MLQSPFAQTLFSGLSIYTWTGRTATVIYLCCDFNNNWSPKSPDVQKKLRWVLTSHNQGTSTLLLAQYVDEFAMFGLIATWFTEIRRWDWCECTLSKAALCNHLLQFTYIHQFFSAGMWAGCNMMGKLLCGRFGDDYFKLFNDAERRICLCSRLGASGKWEQQQLRLEMESANINLQRNTERPNVVFTRPKYFILKNGFTALSVYDSNKGGFLCQNDQNVSHPWTFARVTEINNWSLIFLHSSTDPLGQLGVNGLALGSVEVRGRSRAIKRFLFCLIWDLPTVVCWRLKTSIPWNFGVPVQTGAASSDVDCQSLTWSNTTNLWTNMWALEP